jgi:ferrochelatase
VSLNRRRVAVVLFNLGGPDGPEAVQPFLFNLFRDPAIISVPALVRLPLAALISTTRAPSAKLNYAMMGGASPLLPETRAQSDALLQRLSALDPETEFRTFIAMRYWKPFTEVTAKEVADFQPDHVVLLPLYPHFSTTTTGSSVKAWNRAYRGVGEVHTVCCYPAADGFIEAHAQRILECWTQAGSPANVRLLFSAHGLPEKVIKDGDPYQSQIEVTAAAVAARLGAGWDWQVCYQSRVGPLKWIGPSTIEAISAAAEDGKGVLLTPIAFVSEHVETLVELDHEYAELAEQQGVSPYLRAPALGITAAFIDTLAAAVRSSLEVPGVAPFMWSGCDGCHRQCPRQRDGIPAETTVDRISA